MDVSEKKASKVKGGSRKGIIHVDGDVKEEIVSSFSDQPWTVSSYTLTNYSGMPIQFV